MIAFARFLYPNWTVAADGKKSSKYGKVGVVKNPLWDVSSGRISGNVGNVTRTPLHLRFAKSKGVLAPADDLPSIAPPKQASNVNVRTSLHL